MQKRYGVKNMVKQNIRGVNENKKKFTKEYWEEIAERNNGKREWMLKKWEKDCKK